jgi:hypothetical protein
MGTYAVNIYRSLMCKLTVPQRTIESKTNMQYIFKIICILQSAFTKDLPVIKMRVAHLFSFLCAPMMFHYVLGSVLWYPYTNDVRFDIYFTFNVLKSINDGEYWRGNTKWTIHRNWQHSSHKTKKQTKTKTKKTLTQCALDTTICKQTQITLITKLIII